MLGLFSIKIFKTTENKNIKLCKGKVVLKVFSFPNTTDGGQRLLEKHHTFSFVSDQFAIRVEATGHYWLAPFSFLQDSDLLVYVLNPIQTDGWRKGTEIRKRKTDIIDSVFIADLIRYGSFAENRLSDKSLFSLKQLSRYRAYLATTAGGFERKIIAVLDQVFPEYATVFSKVGVFGKASKGVLLEFSSPEALNELSAEVLAKFLSDTSRNRLGLKKAELLKEAALNFFGIKFAQEGFTFQLRQ